MASLQRNLIKERPSWWKVVSIQATPGWVMLVACPAAILQALTGHKVALGQESVCEHLGVLRVVQQPWQMQQCSPRRCKLRASRVTY